MVNYFYLELSEKEFDQIGNGEEIGKLISEGTEVIVRRLPVWEDADESVLEAQWEGD